jgi:hypothetical protein
LYLDNDDAGDKYTNIVLENFQNAIDCRMIFKDYNDYNEWFLAKCLKTIEKPKCNF